MAQLVFNAAVPANGVLVTTDRLKCVQAKPSDLELMHKLFKDPNMTEFLGGPAEDEKIEEWLKSWESGWAEGKSFCGIVEERQSGKRIGSASIHPSTVPTLWGAEISYVILPEYQRLGYATEMSRALIDYAFRVMGMERVLVVPNADNEPSNRIPKRLGFTFLYETDHAHPEWPNLSKQVVWSLERDNYKLNA